MRFSLMTTRLMVCGLVVVFLGSWSTANDDVATASSIERAGLTADWFTQIQLGSRTGIANLQLQVNEDKSTRYYLIEYDGKVERISQNDLSAFGKPYGIEEAEKYANVRKEIILAELKAQGRGDVEVNIRPISLPKTTIYAGDLQGRVTAIDADTGRSLWTTQVGNRKYLSSGLGASKNYVAVLNGSTAYCLNAENGKILWSQSCSDAPSAPPSINEERMYVPTIDGRVEVFEIADRGANSRRLVSFGSSISQPLLTEKTVSWATSFGHYAIAAVDGRAVRYRLNTNSHFVVGGVFASGSFFVNTVEGSVFALDEERGSLLWEYSTGDRITERPFTKNGYVYAISAEHRLYKIDAVKGQIAPGWENPVEGVRSYVGMSEDKIYVLNNVDQLIALDAESGEKVATVSSSPLTLVLPNYDTDRLYVGTSRGLLRCFREVGNTYPVFHINDGEIETANAKKADVPEKDADDSDPFAVEDPFATDDPFGDEGGGDEGGEEDPFGDGGSDNSSDDDPFGG